MSRTEPGLAWHGPRELRETHLRELRTMKIGPLFPADPDHRPGLTDSRRIVRLGKDTKPPYRRHRAARRRRDHREITAACLSCQFTVTGSTWRPVKRSLSAHVAKKHAKLAKGAA